MVDQFVDLMPFTKKVAGLKPGPGTFLGGVCLFFMFIHGFSVTLNCPLV